MANSEIQSTTEKAITLAYRTVAGLPFTGVSLIVDSSGFNALEFLMEGGDITTSLGNVFYQLVLEDSDTASNFNPVDPDFIITSNDTISVPNQSVSIAYIGKKRFIRPKIIITGAQAGTATIVALGITVMGVANHIPSSPPVLI